MNRLIVFSKNHVRELVATIIVATVFLYFWINGPLLQRAEILSIESIETKYSNPVIVGEDGVDQKRDLTSFKTLHFEEEENHGFGLILDKKTPDNGGL